MMVSIPIKNPVGYVFPSMIRKVGAERTVLGSDLGQVGNPLPMEGIRKCLEIMLNLGVSDEEIDLMIRKNPAKLLNLD